MTTIYHDLLLCLEKIFQEYWIIARFW